MDLRAPLASCLLVAALATASAPASAQGLSAQDEANARFQTGLKYYDNHDFESARLAFTQAYAVLQKPSILLNLALSELYSNHPLEAIGHFEGYIKDPSTSADKREKARVHLEEAMRKTSHLQLRTSAESEVKLDGRPLSPPYTMVHVMPGAHSLESRVGAKTRTASVSPKAGDTLNVDLTIEGEPLAPPEPQTTPAPANPPPAPITEPPSAPTTTDSFWGLRSIGGLVLVAVGGGLIVGGVLSKSEESDQQAKLDEISAGLPLDACTAGQDPRCADLVSARDARNDAATRGNILLGVGIGAAVVGAAGIVSAILWPHRHTSRTGMVVRPSRGGFLFSTNF